MYVKKYSGLNKKVSLIILRILGSYINGYTKSSLINKTRI